MPLNDDKCYPNLSYDLDISADYMNSLFGTSHTGNHNLDDSLFNSDSQCINTSNIRDIAINEDFNYRIYSCIRRSHV